MPAAVARLHCCTEDVDQHRAVCTSFQGRFPVFSFLSVSAKRGRIDALVPRTHPLQPTSRTTLHVITYEGKSETCLRSALPNYDALVCASCSHHQLLLVARWLQYIPRHVFIKSSYRLPLGGSRLCTVCPPAQRVQAEFLEIQISNRAHLAALGLTSRRWNHLATARLYTTIALNTTYMKGWVRFKDCMERFGGRRHLVHTRSLIIYEAPAECKDIEPKPLREESDILPMAIADLITAVIRMLPRDCLRTFRYVHFLSNKPFLGML